MKIKLNYVNFYLSSHVKDKKEKSSSSYVGSFNLNNSLNFFFFLPFSKACGQRAS